MPFSGDLGSLPFDQNPMEDSQEPPKRHRASGRPTSTVFGFAVGNSARRHAPVRGPARVDPPGQTGASILRRTTTSRQNAHSIGCRPAARARADSPASISHEPLLDSQSNARSLLWTFSFSSIDSQQERPYANCWLTNRGNLADVPFPLGVGRFIQGIPYARGPSLGPKGEASHVQLGV